MGATDKGIGWIPRLSVIWRRQFDMPTVWRGAEVGGKRPPQHPGVVVGPRPGDQALEATSNSPNTVSAFGRISHPSFPNLAATIRRFIPPRFPPTNYLFICCPDRYNRIAKERTSY